MERWSRTVVVVALGLGLVACGARPRPRLEPSASSQPATQPTAYEVLRDTGLFSDTYVGEMAQLSPEVAAYRVLVRRSSRAEFERLLAEARPAGKLYALCGLYQLRADSFAQAAEELARSVESVIVVVGCLVWERPVSEIVEEIVSGDWPKQFLPPIPISSSCPS